MLLERDQRCRGTPTLVSVMAGAAAGFALTGALVIGLGFPSLPVGERAATALVDGVAAAVLVAGARQRWRQQRRYEWLLAASVSAMLCVAAVGYSQALSGGVQERVQASVGQTMTAMLAIVGSVALMCDGSRTVPPLSRAIERV